MTIKDTSANPADTEALAEIERQIAAWEGPFGDADPVSATAADDTDADETTDEPAAEEEQGDEPQADAEDEPAAEEVAAEVEAPAENLTEPQTAHRDEYQTRPRAELQSERTALRAERSEAFQKFSAGEMSAEEYQVIETRVDDALDEITTQFALATANEQNARREQLGHVDRIKALGKAQGVDYEQPGFSAQFDHTLRKLTADPIAVAKGVGFVYDEAHRLTVMALRGVAPAAKAAAAPAPTGKPPARERPAAPLTLRSMPAAASSQSDGGVSDRLARATGMDFEDALGAMNRAQREAWLNS